MPSLCQSLQIRERPGESVHRGARRVHHLLDPRSPEVIGGEPEVGDMCGHVGPMPLDVAKPWICSVFDRFQKTPIAG